MPSGTREPPGVTAEPFLEVIHPTGAQPRSGTTHLVLARDTEFPESVNKMLNHDLSTPGAKAPKPVNVNHSEHL